jgi:osmoprotectant transport system ATP-binding protein
VPSEPILEAAGVAKTYGDGTAAVAGIDLAVSPGETVALVGESGSGKTTLLRTFNRMVEPSAGAVWIEGKSVADLDPIVLRRRTGYVPQDGGLIPHWRVERNVELVPRLLGWDAARRQARAREMLELVGLSPEAHARRYPAELSGGQRQRVAIARALVREPRLLLCDEPTGNLDRTTAEQVAGVLLDLHRSQNTSLVIVTHSPQLAGKCPIRFELTDRALKRVT